MTVIRSKSCIGVVISLLLLLVDSYGAPSNGIAQEVDELQKSRVEIYSELTEVASMRYKNGNGKYEDLVDANVMLLDAKIDAASNADERLELRREKVEVLSEFEVAQKARHAEGSCTLKSLLLTRARKIEAKIAERVASDSLRPKANPPAQSNIEKLAADQLAAYNRADIDAFCACYHPNVRVFDGEKESLVGIEQFRKRYENMFAKGGFSAKVSQRIVHSDHCVDLEHWQRANGKRGTVLVHYTEKDGLIGVVRFLR